MRHAIVLAAGEGRKIWPYGEFRQKCTLPVANVPAVRRLCLSLREMGVQDIAVVVGHYAQQVKGVTADVPGVRYVLQTVRDGTATAALAAYESLGDAPDALIVYGDIVTPTDNLRALVDEFRASGSEVGALVAPLRDEPSGSWLCAGITNGRVRDVRGHPRGGSHRLCGVYAFRAPAIRYLLRNPGVATRVDVGGMPPPESEVAGSLHALLDEGKDILAVETREFFVDLDKPWHVLEANARMAEYLCARVAEDHVGNGARVSDGADIAGRIVVGSNTVIGRGVAVHGSAIVGANTNIVNGAILRGHLVIGDQCRVSDYCDVGGRSVIGSRCIVGHGAEFSGVLFDKVYLYHYCEMAGVFGQATDIGAATVCGTLRFDDADTIQNIHGRRETPPHGANVTYMGDYCRTGVNAILMPGVKVGSYSCVGPGVVCYEDVPSRTLLLLKQELIRKPWGPERYGW